MAQGDLAQATFAYGPSTPERARWGDRAVQAFIWACGAFVLLTTLLMIAFLASAGIRGMSEVGLSPLLFGVTWKPEKGLFGGVPLVFGTIVSGLGAVVLGAAPAVLTAVWISEFAPQSLRPVYRRAMEMAAAMPSVVYGWLALVHLVPTLERVAHSIYGDEVTGGEGLAASALLLAVMIAPTVFLLSLDALSRVSNDFRHASLVLGASPWQTALRVVVPACWRGIIVAVFFGFARAAGETMAVQMVIGGARRLPATPFSPTTTISAQIVMDMQNAEPGTPSSNVLFSMALILLVISAAVVLGTRALARRRKP